MATLIGAMLAMAVGVMATLMRMDRDRSFYVLIMLVTASFYGLFAIMGGPAHGQSGEWGAVVAFIGITLLGYRLSLWIVVAAFVLHGVYDAFHSHLVVNNGVPVWWPAFCLAYDGVAALYLAALLLGGRLKSREGAPAAYADRIRPHVQAELDAARRCELLGDPAEGFRHLERAHVLGQASTVEHVRVHWQMLLWSVRYRRWSEVLAQWARIFGAATKTWLGLVPTGNTGGGNVRPFQRMSVPEDLATLIESARPGIDRQSRTP